MKAITLTQPWATLVAIGAKRIETRSWPTAYRGSLAIHAAKGLAGMTDLELVQLCTEPAFSAALVQGGFPLISDLPRGAVIATCRLVDCVQIVGAGHEIPGDYMTILQPDRTWREESEEAFGNYAPGRWAWLLADVRLLPEPLPARGSLGLWEWPLPAAAKPAKGCLIYRKQ